MGQYRRGTTYNSKQEANHTPTPFKQPKEITICNLEVFVMPNGEVLCCGKSLGWFDLFMEHLSVKPAVNSHAALVRALEAVEVYWKMSSTIQQDGIDVRNIVKGALKLARICEVK